MKTMVQRMLLLLTLGGLAGHAAGALAETDSGEPALEAGRALTQQWMAGEIAGLWDRLGAQMQAVVGNREGLAQAGAGILAQLGEEKAVLSEEITRQQDIAVYRRVSEWSGTPTPIAVTWALGPTGLIEGFSARPAPAENLGVAVPAGETPDGRLPGDEVVAQYLEEFVDQRQVAPGVVVGLFDSEGARFVAHGDAGDGRRPDADTVFEAGSVTKGLTGLLLAQMADAGNLGLDQPIRELLPAELDVAPGVAAITLEELATHRSGLPRLSSGPEMQARMTSADPYAGSTPEEIFADLARVDAEQVAAGRGTYAYSNFGSALLGQLLARAGGMSYGELLARRVFEPLGLGAPVLAPAAVDGRRAQGHQSGQPVAPWTLDAYAPAGAWQTSARDALALAQRLVGGKPAWVTAALAPRGGDGTGLAWHQAAIADRMVTWHNGGTAGSSSFLAVVPDEGVALVVLANAGGGVADGLARTLLGHGR